MFIENWTIFGFTWIILLIRLIFLIYLMWCRAKNGSSWVGLHLKWIDRTGRSRLFLTRIRDSALKKIRVCVGSLRSFLIRGSKRVESWCHWIIRLISTRAESWLTKTAWSRSKRRRSEAFKYMITEVKLDTGQITGGLVIRSCTKSPKGLISSHFGVKI